MTAFSTIAAPLCSGGGHAGAAVLPLRCSLQIVRSRRPISVPGGSWWPSCLCGMVSRSTVSCSVRVMPPSCGAPPGQRGGWLSAPIWLALVFGWGLAGIWSGLSAFIVLRLMFRRVAGVLRRWLVPGSG